MLQKCLHTIILLSFLHNNFVVFSLTNILGKTTDNITRRQWISHSLAFSALYRDPTTADARPDDDTYTATTPSNNINSIPHNNLKVLTHPNSHYSSLIYEPPQKQPNEKFPLILFLHGAGTNHRNISNLYDINGEHYGLLPSLIANNTAPRELMDNFIVVAPYSYNKRSFYDEPRSTILNLLNDAMEYLSPRVDPSRVFLFGFSDGATLGVELLTTRRFAGGVICSYGFVGTLPDLALRRLSSVPMWVFHSVDDVIFRVRNSDELVRSLREVGGGGSDDDGGGGGGVRYTRFSSDPEGFVGAVRGHTTGITASRDPNVYRWLLSLPPLN